MYDRERILKMDDSAAVSKGDNQTGQEETRVNSVTIFLFGAPAAILVIYLSARCCIFAKLRVLCKKQEE